MRLRLFIAACTLFIISFAPASAQQLLRFTIAEFAQDPLDLSARNEQYQRKDDNGALYSIIKVKSDRPDDDLQAYRFDFGLMNSFTVHHPETEELWVYVQKNAKSVSISREGYISVAKYDLHTTIDAGCTYVMRLSINGPTVRMQMVLFRVKPAAAKAVIMVKGERQDAVEEVFGMVDENGAAAKSLPFGAYTYRVAAENYYPSEGRFTLNNQVENHVEDVTLRGNFGNITLNVDSDAEIYVDGEKKGVRTWIGALKAGIHQVECRQASHRPSTHSITVAEHETRTVTLTPPTPISGTLSITSRPLGAKIRIDGKEYGETPKQIAGLLVGKHSVELTANGRKGAAQDFEIQENQTTNVEMELAENYISLAADSLGLCPDNRHPHMIDMGTGVKWACCNVGALSPIEYGAYFAWGETKPKEKYDWSTYKWHDGSYKWYRSHGKMTKYCTSKKDGKKDNLILLEFSDDAAHVNWNGTWRMPTIDELSNLNSKCTWTWTTISHVAGYKVSSTNGNCIFLPAAGYRTDSSLYDAGSDGGYWSSSLNTLGNDGAGLLRLRFGSSGHNTGGFYWRYNGRSVRPVSN